MTAKAAVAVWWLLALSYPLWVALGVISWSGYTRIGVEGAPGADGRHVIEKMVPAGSAWLSGAHVGDVLFEIDGREVTQVRWEERGDSGREFRIQTTDGRIITHVFEGGYLSMGPFAVNSVIISLVFALTGFLIFFRSTHTSESLAASILFLTSATAFAVAPAGARALPWASYVLGSSILLSAGLFFILLSLMRGATRGRWPISRVLRWGMGAWLVAELVLYTLSITVLAEFYEAARQLGLLQMAVGLAGGIGFLVHSYLTTDSRVMKERLRIIVFGFTAGVVPFVILRACEEIGLVLWRDDAGLRTM